MSRLRCVTGLRVLSFIAMLVVPASTLMAQEPAPDEPPSSLALRYRYIGYLGENHGDAASCTRVRKGGTITVDTALTHVDGQPPGEVIYRGSGDVVMDIDECNLKPVAGGVHDYCAVSISSRFEARVSLEIRPLEDGVPREVSLDVTPMRPLSASVTGDCEAETIAQVKTQLLDGSYWNGQLIGLGDEAVLRSMVAGGIPRVGTHVQHSDDEAPLGRWTISIDEDAETCEGERTVLEQSRLLVAVAAADAQDAFVETWALADGLVAVPGVAPLATSLAAEQGALTAAFAARVAAAAGSARDAAEAAYGATVGRVVAAHGAGHLAQLAVAEAPSPSGAPADPRVGQLSGLLQRFGARAQVLATALEALDERARRYAACGAGADGAAH